MKRLFKIVCALFLGFSLCACSSNEDESIRKVVSGYFDALHEGNLQKAQGFCDKSFDDETGLSETTDTLAKQLKELDLGDAFNSEANTFIQTMIKSTVQEYEILNYKVDGDKATVNLDVTGINTLTLDLTQAQQDGVAELSTYINDNMDSLNEILNDKGEEAMKQKIVDEASVILFGKMNEVIEKSPTQTKTVQVTLKKTDGKWLLTAANQ